MFASLFGKTKSVEKVNVKKTAVKKIESVAHPKPVKKEKKRSSGDLAGSKFRWLNEQLYSKPGSESKEMFTAEPHLFQQYHDGFSQQAAQWPTNPVTECISWLQRHPKLKAIGDFGCGTAAVAASLHQSRSVHSFDLVDNGNPLITPCDISKVPLKGESLDVAIFNLSLMGTDWPSFIEEARRCLRHSGVLYISEVTSRMKDPEGFARSLEAAGFKVIGHKASKGGFFHTFVSRKEKSSGLPMNPVLLGKCHYKKR